MKTLAPEAAAKHAATIKAVESVRHHLRRIIEGCEHRLTTPNPRRSRDAPRIHVRPSALAHAANVIEPGWTEARLDPLAPRSGPAERFRIAAVIHAPYRR